MKRLIVGFVILAISLPSFAFGLTTCRDRSTGCSLGELLVLNDQATAMGISEPEHVTILLEIITHLRRIITNFAATSQVSYCVDLKHNLVPSSTDAQTDGEVSTLQLFLTSAHVYPEGLITGVYGPLTAKAVVRWQKEQGMSDVTEKSGVGKMTRQKIREATCALVQ